MGFVVRLLLANALILAAAQLGRRHPSLAGLIATMPLTTLVVMAWLYSEAPGDYPRMIAYTKGVLWGILPGVAFFLTALACFQRKLPFAAVLLASLAVWLAGAAMHRWLLS